MRLNRAVLEASANKTVRRHPETGHTQRFGLPRSFPRAVPGVGSPGWPSSRPVPDFPTLRPILWNDVAHRPLLRVNLLAKVLDLLYATWEVIFIAFSGTKTVREGLESVSEWKSTKLIPATTNLYRLIERQSTLSAVVRLFSKKVF